MGDEVGKEGLHIGKWFYFEGPGMGVRITFLTKAFCLLAIRKAWILKTGNISRN